MRLACKLIAGALLLAGMVGGTAGRLVAEEAQEAAAPSVLLYQGRLTDVGGLPRTGSVSLTFTLYADAGTTTPLWSETHPAVPLSDGIFSLLLGSVAPFPANAWADGERFLGISVDGGSELVPRLRIASVPFAIEANRLNGKRSTDFEPTGAAAIAAAGVASQLKGSDATPPNDGSNQVHWNNLYGVPEGLADGQDQIGDGVALHGQLQGLNANDHPQYVLGSVLQTTDGSAPNVGANKVHWDNLGGMPQELADNVLPKSWIAPGSLDSSNVAAAGLSGANIAAGSVTRSRIAPGAVGGAQVEDGSLTGADIQNGSLSGNQVANGSLTGVDIQDESIFTSDIANGGLLGADIAAGAIGAAHVQDGALPGSKLQDGTLPGAKIQDNSVTGAKLTQGAIGGRELAGNAVTGENVQDGSLSVAHLEDAPGVAFVNIAGFVDTVETTDGRTVASLTMTAPAPGFVILTGAAQVHLIHNLGTTSRVTLALSEFPDIIQEEHSATILLPGSYPSELYLYPVQMQTVFPVAGAGPVTFYLNARKGDQPRVPSLHNVRIQALYVRTGY